MPETSILLGWPLEPAIQPGRPFAASRRGNRFTDVGRATAYRRDGHLLTLAPTGAGKGVRVIIPNLLHYSGPIITVDPKGENFAITARFRREVLGQRIYLLDPFEAVANETLDMVGCQRGSLNPLDLLAEFTGHIEPQLTMLASMFAPDDREGHDFWHQEALKLLAGVIGATVDQANARGRSPEFQGMIDMLFVDDTTYSLAELLDTQKSLGKFAYRAISAFLQKTDKERSGVMSTVHSYLTPFLSSHINTSLNSSTIRPRMILDDDDYTIYIVLPPSKLISHSILLRIWISTLLTAIMEREAKPLKRTLFMLDECAQLGRLEALTKAVTLLRGYGLQVWMFFQDIGQLISLYRGDHTTVINNCEVFQAFGMTRFSAAEPVSEITGRFEPLDLVQLDKTQQLLSLATDVPKVLRSMNYLQDPLFAGRYDGNPLFRQQEKLNPMRAPFPPNAISIHV